MTDSSAQIRAYVKTPFLRTGSAGQDERSGSVSRSDEFETKALYLSTTVSSFRPPATAPSRIGFDPEADFDYESKTVTPDTYDTEVAVLRHRYKKLCQSLGVVPLSSLMKQVGMGTVVVKDVCLAPLEFKAALTLLVLDTELTQLTFSGNKVTKQESEYLGQLLRTNRFLTHLVLSDNQLSGVGLETLVPLACEAKGLRSLDLSSNGLCDRDSKSLCRLIEDTECISELILHHNELGQCGVALGTAIANNDTITSLNLSWNHIRGAGAVGLAKGVGKNGRLTHVNFSWNGFGFEGCVALGQVLRSNSTLRVLDLTNNRIHPPALFQLLPGVCGNKTLSSLFLGLNPIPSHYTTIMLNRLGECKHSNLKELDLQGIVVDKDFMKVLEKIQSQRMFLVRFDQSRPLHGRKESKVDPTNIFNIDPMRILFFMKEHLRTIDLFLKIDQDNDGFLTRDEMKYAFELEGYPVSDKALDQVMGYLDTNRSGEVDLGEFFSGERRMRREQTKEKQEEEERRQRLQRQATENPLAHQGVGQTYSQTFKKPPPGRLPKLTK